LKCKGCPSRRRAPLAIAQELLELTNRAELRWEEGVGASSVHLRTMVDVAKSSAHEIIASHAGLCAPCWETLRSDLDLEKGPPPP